MAAPNGRVSFRASRGPSFLVVGLAVVSVILFYSYWSVSSKNSRLLKDVSILQDRLRVIAAKKVTADKRNSALANQIQQERNEYLRQSSADKKAREEEKTRLSRTAEDLSISVKTKEEKLEKLEQEEV